MMELQEIDLNKTSLKYRRKHTLVKKSKLVKKTSASELNVYDFECWPSLSAPQANLKFLWNSVTLQPTRNFRVKIKDFQPSKLSSEDVAKKSSTISTSEQSEVRFDQVSVKARRYPRRNMSSKNYREKSIPRNDDFIYCDICKIEYEGVCSIHPLILLLNNEASRDSCNPERARETTPWPLSICFSKIREAGKGVWTNCELPKGLVFGPYEGRILKNILPKPESGYGWEVKNCGSQDYIVDALDTSVSNWLRYVNCSRSYEETNLVAFQYKGEIYYRTISGINRGTELLVWYGDEYGEELGYSLEHPKVKVCSKPPMFL